MKRALSCLVAILTTLTLLGQSFEGKIVYANSFKSKNEKITDQQWNSMMGTVYEYFIKGGDYKSVANGTLMQWQLYLGKDNKLYNKMSNSPAVLWNDGSVNPDTVLKAEMNKGVTEVLGYKCDELVLTCKSGVQKYYFNASLAASPKLFASHKFGNWADYVSRAKALPLKSVIENEQFILETTATEVKPMKLDNKLFALPPDAKLEKSPY
jgi:hypothetical protein